MFDPLHPTERATIAPDCGEPLATFKPIFSHRASPPKARATIALDSWSIRFEPGRCHGSTCLRLRTNGSCELLTASWRTRSAARRDEAGVLSVGSFKPETNHRMHIGVYVTAVPP